MAATAATKLYRTTGQAAKELGVELWQLLRLLHLRRLPDVSRVEPTRVWSEDDVALARRLLAEAGVIKGEQGR
jgi:hypothetical protein